VVTTSGEALQSAERIILPGVGAAGEAMERLQAHQLETLIPELTQPVLGICVGMQVLFAGSEEDDVDCLGVFEPRLRRIVGDKSHPVPHMGWNQVESKQAHPLLNGIGAEDYCYFVHSYAAQEFESTIGVTHYNQPFTAAVAEKNFMGVQFHPERSGEVGSRVLKNFLELTP